MPALQAEIFASNAGNSTMAQLTIRNLDEEIITRLKAKAAAAGHSMEQEAREILHRETMGDKVAETERFRRRLASYGDKVFSDSGELVRQMRDERSEWLDRRHRE
jgi:antitoxin FitA